MRTTTLARVLCTAAAVIACTIASAQGDSSAQDDSIVIDAVWKPQRVIFEYRAYGTYYSCSGLRERVRSILQRLGAHERMLFADVMCTDDPTFIRMAITFASPVEATPENVRELTTYDTQQLMIARLRGETLPSAQDLPRFRAAYTTIAFSRDRALRLQPGDCELVRQLSKQILPSMSVRVLSDVTTCMEATRLGRPKLKVAALVPVPESALSDSRDST